MRRMCGMRNADDSSFTLVAPDKRDRDINWHPFRSFFLLQVNALSKCMSVYLRRWKRFHQILFACSHRRKKSQRYLDKKKCRSNIRWKTPNGSIAFYCFVGCVHESGLHCNFIILDSIPGSELGWTLYRYERFCSLRSIQTLVIRTYLTSYTTFNFFLLDLESFPPLKERKKEKKMLDAYLKQQSEPIVPSAVVWFE